MQITAVFVCHPTGSERNRKVQSDNNTIKCDKKQAPLRLVSLLCIFA